MRCASIASHDSTSFAIGDAVDSNASDRDMLPGGRHTHERPTLRATERPPSHYLVAFGDLIVDGAVVVGKPVAASPEHLGERAPALFKAPRNE
jgi:hypothetical protein